MTKVYNVGDMVWVANFRSEEIKVPCPVCYGNKHVVVVLGNGEKVEVECDYCGHGFEGPRGYVIEYQYLPSVEYISITGKEVKKTQKGIEIEYNHLLSGEYDHSYSSMHLKDIFDTEEEAYQFAIEKAEKYQSEQDNKIKYKNEKSYTWNAGYHMREAKSKQHDAEYHLKKAQLCKQKSKSDQP